MTEHHTFGREVAPKPIGLGSYGTDTHEIRRIVKDGVVIREGKTATGRGGAPPYPIGYDAIVPRSGECENLLVTFALSASHTAFSSIRMEPVFMVTSQSAATAACLPIDAKVRVQKVDCESLRTRLVQDGQILGAKRIAAGGRPLHQWRLHRALDAPRSSNAVRMGEAAGGVAARQGRRSSVPGLLQALPIERPGSDRQGPGQ